jgi:hypothetical protein
LVSTAPLEPAGDEPTPDPDVLDSQRTPPDGEPPDPRATPGSNDVPEEPGVGLEQVRRAPLDEAGPVPSGPNVGPAVLHDSGPTPASIARGSRVSTTESIEQRVRRAGRSFALRRVTGVLLGRPLPRGAIPALWAHRRRGFHFRQEIGSRSISRGRRRWSHL